MCNLYSNRKGPAAILDLARATRNAAGNLEPGNIYPDYAAPIVRTEGADRVLATARWGMPSSRKAILDAATKRADRLRAKGKDIDFDQLLKMEPDGGTTNVRNTSSLHWRRWLTPEHRCLVPFTAFSEPGRDAMGKYRPVWFALDRPEDDPLAFFAGIQMQGWQGVRKIKTGWETADLFAFLTTEPSEPVKSVHPKAMPVILTEPDEIEKWMTAPWEEARRLQKPLPADALQMC
ncbi:MULTISPECIES: SOS response-associated peptidase [unclassified Brevundimonas]|uniref:SOS response-associated peptidase n=1 Tax=unclassified Brevundimonas TaxID=2622653 RepID=UPI0025C2A598|nr:MULTISPECIES: SOS response-associated peptidase family protein [unclassified Brevundimonas]